MPFLPAELFDFVGRGSPVEQVFFEFGQFALSGFPDVVAFRFRTDAEVGKRYERTLIEFDDCFLSFVVPHPEQTPGVLVVFDMDDRFEDEVRPADIGISSSGTVITIV